MAKIKGTTKPEQSSEHPEERAARIKAEAEALKRIDAFLKKHPSIARDVISNYADAEAEEQLANYRELFWGVW